VIPSELLRTALWLLLAAWVARRLQASGEESKSPR